VVKNRKKQETPKKQSTKFSKFFLTDGQLSQKHEAEMQEQSLTYLGILLIMI